VVKSSYTSQWPAKGPILIGHLYLYLNLRMHGSILTEDQNATSEGMEKIAVVTSLIGNENWLNMYLNPRVHGSIPIKRKKSTRKGGGEDRDSSVGITKKSSCYR
jgi:hypothetical protein